MYNDLVAATIANDPTRFQVSPRCRPPRPKRLRLILAGVFDTFPDLHIVLGH
jgi:predicted TIM-barrel fold metal-dependent hydrolase